MKRRHFLWLSFAGTATLSVPLSRCSDINEQWRPLLSRPEVLSRFCDAPTLKEIGENYRKKFREEDDMQRLEELLMDSLAAKELRGATNESLFYTSLRKQIENDFRSNRITKTAGWIISVTEARQCALFSFSQL